jgi:branched-subunit amino acid transport protein
MNIWWLMLVSGAVTFLIRYSFIAAEGHYRPPAWFRRLSALRADCRADRADGAGTAAAAGRVVLGAGNARLWAGVVAIAVAAIWRNTLLTIGAAFLPCS